MDSNQNENIISIENEMELNVNEMNIIKEIMGTLEQNESLQTKNNLTKNNEKKAHSKIAFSKKIWK
jgi:hypothetical protein